MEQVGVVNKIIPFSAVDGPGCRTAVFLQGCNLNCRYCHNPETISFCKECGICIKYCKAGAIEYKDGHIKYDESICVQCDNCLKVCPNNSSPKTKVYTPKKMAKIIFNNIPFIRGVTFSGGECSLQKKFLEEIVPIIKDKNLDVLLDSNGTFQFNEFETILNQVDGVMLDIKAFDKEEHKKITTKENDTILKNAVNLAEIGKLKEVRTVIIPELFDANKTIQATAELLKSFLTKNNIQYKLIAYRPFGVRNQYAGLKTPSAEYLNELREILESYGFKQVIIT